eukprot:gb/GEZN01000543.1/.p1 GENE.gb/GEZN01000543.1/~~gb/GEZN01000543.1/.p1  ORF type:complete len:1258 (+),score=342.68 gb/GEZN01000543.1/:130-3903(+)
MTTDSGKSFLKMENDDGPFTANPKSLDGVPDLCMLTYLGELNVLHNLKHRYENKEVYTSTTAKVIVAMNPYESMPANYTEARMKAYQDQASNLEGLADKNSLPPHLFWVANSAFSNLVAMKANQSIIVCGESGSGKTESAKYMMRFLAFTTTSLSTDPSEFAEAEAIGQQVLDANPILESFGNAKTLINNNSSRFGKFTKMLFRDGKTQGALKLVGAGIDSYLLEKSRVVYQDQGERNYHVFYQLTHCRAEHPELKLNSPEQHKYTGQSNCTTLEDLRYTDKNTVDKMWHKELEDAWTVLKIPREESLETYGVVAAILHLGDIKFKDKTGEGSDITNSELLPIIANQFGVGEAALRKRLEIRTLMLPGGQLLEKPLNQPDAEFNRDSICRSVYNGLFRWVVNRINKVSFPQDAGKVPSYIGILDVFGFEIFANNSFEQFCINFANERLQQYFNEHVLMAEQILYQREALLWNPIALPDNQDCIDLFTRKPQGIYAILDSTCIQPKGDDEVFTQNLFQQYKYHPKLRKTETREGTAGKPKEAINGFTVKHYAGQVLYNAAEFLVKNSDSSEFDTIEMMWASTKNVPKFVLMMQPDGTMDTKVPTRSAKRAFLSTGSVFADQLSSLMGELKKTAPYFVRCVKPNPQKKPRHFVGEFVRPQLRCGGLIEALRIIKLGFPTRCKYSRVQELFAGILKKKPVTNLNQRDFTEAIMAVAGDQSLKPNRDEFQMGLTMIFFRPGKQAFLTDILEKDPATITDAQVDKIREFLTKKRWVRAVGLSRGWIRTNGYLSTIRFTKAAITMHIMYRVFGRALKSARAHLNGKDEEEEARRRAQDVEFQMALKAKKDLEEMKMMEEARMRKMEEEKNKLGKLLSDKDADLEAERVKTERAEGKYAEMQKEKEGAIAKYEDAQQKYDKEAGETQAKIEASAAREKAAAADLVTAKEREKKSQADAAKLREELNEIKLAAGSGKDEYEKQLRDKSAKVAELEKKLEESKAGRQQDQQQGSKQVQDKDATIEDLKRQIQDAETSRAQQKADSEQALADKEQAIKEEEAKLKEAKALEEKQRGEAKEQKKALRDEMDQARKALVDEKAALELKVKVMEKETKAKAAELDNLTKVVVKEKEAEMVKLKEEVTKSLSDVEKARTEAADSIEKNRESTRVMNEKMETDLRSANQSLALIEVDMKVAVKEREEIKDKLEKDIEIVKQEVGAEHAREHQASMNELKQTLGLVIKDLQEKAAQMESDLEAARKWRKGGGK